MVVVEKILHQIFMGIPQTEIHFIGDRIRGKLGPSVVKTGLSAGSIRGTMDDAQRQAKQSGKLRGSM